MKMVSSIALTIMAVGAAIIGSVQLDAQTTELLWPGGAPGAVGSEELDKPTITFYAPPEGTATGVGIVVLPGGGYSHLAIDKEGWQVAEYLNSKGIAAFVTTYRLGDRYRHPAPLQDAQRAIRIVRSRATEFGVDPERVGILGFSAGGHLASTAATLFTAGDPMAADPVDRVSSRPDFAVLCYPVISLNQPYTHIGSREKLLGENPAPELVASLSTETRITANTPPVFLFHTNADTAVPPENSVMFYLGLRKAGVPAEMHVFEPENHGRGLAQQYPALAVWPELMVNWLRTRGLLE